MQFIFRLLWKFIKRIPGEKVIQVSKGLLPSVWAFYFMGIPSSIKFWEMYVVAYADSKLVILIVYYLMVYFIFYFVIDFLFRWILLRKLQKGIVSFFTNQTTSEKREQLMQISDAKKTFIKGMGYSMDLGYLSKKDISSLEEIKKVSKEDIEQMNFEFGNLVVKWSVLILHGLLTLLIVYSFNWLIISGLILLLSLLLALFFTTVVIMVTNINAAEKIRQDLKKY